MKRIHRSSSDRVVAGVAGGIAEYLSVDPVAVRLVLIFLFVATGFFPLVIAYLVAVFIVPKGPLYVVMNNTSDDTTTL